MAGMLRGSRSQGRAKRGTLRNFRNIADYATIVPCFIALLRTAQHGVSFLGSIPIQPAEVFPEGTCVDSYAHTWQLYAMIPGEGCDPHPANAAFGQTHSGT